MENTEQKVVEWDEIIAALRRRDYDAATKLVLARIECWRGDTRII